MIVLLGLSYKTANIQVREMFSFTNEQITEFSLLLMKNKHVKGVVILFTCNRTEIFLHTNHQNKMDIYNCLIKNR